MLSGNRSVISLLGVARHHPYLEHLVDKILALDPDVSIVLLLGPDPGAQGTGTMQ